MASASGYDYSLSAEVFRFCQTKRGADRQALGDAFQFLADHPFLDGDYQETGRDGRTMEVLLKGRFLLTFWTDHPLKEVRIARIEWA